MLTVKYRYFEVQRHDGMNLIKITRLFKYDRDKL